MFWVGEIHVCKKDAVDERDYLYDTDKLIMPVRDTTVNSYTQKPFIYLS